jgi:hypothetical protein
VGDGVTDDTAAIQAANDATAAVDGEMVIPDGTYKTTAKLIFTCNVRGLGSPRIMSTGDYTSVEYNKHYGYLKNITIYPEDTTFTSNDGLLLTRFARTLIENVFVKYCGRDGIKLDSSPAAGSGNLAVLHNCWTRYNIRDGIRIDGGVNSNAIRLSSLDVGGNGGNGITFGPGLCAGNVLDNVVAQNNTGYGIYFDGADTRNNIGTAYVEANTAGDVYFSATSHSNYLHLTNDGAGVSNNNVTNTVLLAGSGPTQRYRFNTMDFIKMRVYNWSDIGQLEFSHTGNRAYKIEHAGSGSSGSLLFSKGSASSFNTTFEGAITASSIRPSVDNTHSLGIASLRWSEVFAATGTINTSDENLKQDIRALDTKELAVATSLKGLLKVFRFKDAVASKGDAARKHFGIIAQEVQSAFADGGLDASEYGVFCEDTWYEVDGSSLDEYGEPYTVDTPNATAVTQQGVRYTELLVFIMSTL